MAVQFVSSIVIARLLTPDEIGVFSVAVVAVSIAHTIREFGIVSYLIKEETLTDEKIRAASALSFATSWTLAVIIFASSFGLASFYRDPRLLHLLWVLALNFILIPFGSVVYAILRREMHMGTVFILRTVSGFCGAAASIVLAWLGFGPLSLALSLSVNLVLMVALVQFVRPVGMPRMPSFRGAMSIVNFSAFSLTSSLATDVAKAAPNVVLGRVQSMTSVGLFGRAMGLVDMFSVMIENSVWSVSLPYFSRLKREGRNVGEALARTQAYISGLAWPFYAVLALCARPVILTLYGTQWEGSVAPAQILCAFGAIVATTSFASTAMTAVDMIGPATRMNVKICLMRILVTIAAAPFGLLPLAVALIGAAAIEFVIVLSATHRTLGVAPSKLAPSYARSAALAVICALPLLGLLEIGALSDTGLVGLAAVAVLSVVVWTAGLYLTRHPLREEMSILISHLLKRPMPRK
jgi:O-antigen/teichoic acid export membrane protein